MAFVISENDERPQANRRRSHSRQAQDEKRSPRAHSGRVLCLEIDDLTRKSALRPSDGNLDRLQEALRKAGVAEP
jgi:hypothetical protein